MICNDCPRMCGAERTEHISGGVCRSFSLPSLVRAAPHFGEEPCISGAYGSGTIFFSGCNLRCIFCQNYEISRNSVGKKVTVSEFRDILFRLRDTGVHNINLVTPTHFTRFLAEALSGINLDIPVVWNSSGYESVEALKMLDGLIQIYMPDFKYTDEHLAKKYSAALDYPERAKGAILEMYRQRGAFATDENGILRSGVLIRHLILPGEAENSMNVIDFVSDTFPPGSVLFSLMSQYTPMPAAVAFEKLTHTVSSEEVDLLKHYMATRGITEGYWQDSVSATEEMIPKWDLTGIN